MRSTMILLAATFSLLATAFVISGGTAPSVPANGYLMLRFQKLGDIKGGSMAVGHQGAIDVTDVVNKSTLPFDMSTGIAWAHDDESPKEEVTIEYGALTVRPPLVITVGSDQAALALLQSKTSNDTISSAKFTFFRPAQDASGRMENYYTIELSGGKIVSVVPDGAKPFKIGFSYTKITCTFTKGGKSVSRTWQKPG